MARYIDADKMQDFIVETNDIDDWCVSKYNADWISSFIESQPTADVVEVKHGYWKDNNNGTFTCSVCGGKASKMNWCGCCGAKMDKGGEQK